MRFLILGLLLAAPLAAQNFVGVYGNPQIPANNVAQGRTDYSVFAFAAAQLSGSGSVSFTACTFSNIAGNPAGQADTVRIRLIRDSYPYNLSYEAADTVVATVNNPTFPVTFSGFNETLPSATGPNPWPYFVIVDVAGVGTSTVGRVYQLSLTSLTQTGIMTTSFPINGNAQTIVAPSNAEMDVQRGASVAAGGQDYVGPRLAGSAFVLTYTILNTGSDPLNLTGNPRVEIITITVTNCSANVTLQPATPVAATTGSTTFEFTITPTTAGQQFGFGFIINNNDNDENPYNIVVVGDAVSTLPAASQLAITTQPGNGTGGTTLSPQPEVEARDGTGALDSSYTGAVTASISSGTGTSGATLLGTTTVNAVGGVATFSSLAINLVGTGYTLTFTSGALTPDVSNTFDVALGVAAQMVITIQPAGARAEEPFTVQPQLALVDAGGNAVFTDNSTVVTAAIASGTGASGAVLSGTTAVTAVAGVVTFTDLQIDLDGFPYQLEFTAAGVAPAVSASFQVLSREASGSGGDDAGCTTSAEHGWLMLAALLAAMSVAVRLRSPNR